MARFLLAGVPRSGTSWTGEALAHAAGVTYVDEPDGFRDAFSFRTMMRHGENPVLDPGESAPDYERLWFGAFAGGRPDPGVRARIGQRAYRSVDTSVRQRARAGEGVAAALRIAQRLARPPLSDPGARHVLVKSVQCARSIEWIQQRFDPRIVLLLRHPLNVLSSWRDLGFVRNPRETASMSQTAWLRWGIAAPDSAAPQLAQQAFMFGVLTESLLEAAERHPEWVIEHHEALCDDAPARMRNLAADLGLTWTPEAEEFIRDSDRVGEGFDTRRVARDQADRWRTRLTDEEVDVIRGVLKSFPRCASTKHTETP